MQFTKHSAITGKMNTMDLPVTQGQVDDWKGGTLIQDAMPNLDNGQREFLISGSTPEEWASFFGPSE